MLDVNFDIIPYEIFGIKLVFLVKFTDAFDPENSINILTIRAVLKLTI